MGGQLGAEGVVALNQAAMRVNERQLQIIAMAEVCDLPNRGLQLARRIKGIARDYSLRYGAHKR